VFDPKIQFNISCTIRLIFCLAFLWVLVYFLFYDTFAFNYESYLNQQYVLIFWLPILVMQFFWLYRNIEHLYNPVIPLFIISFVLCLICASSHYSFGNEYFFTTTIIAAISYGVFLFRSVYLLRVIVSAFLLLFIVELYLGMVQRFSSPYNGGLQITGSLKNSGVYACYLVVNLPFLYWLYSTIRRSILKSNNPRITFSILRILFALALVIVSYLIYCTKSRTAFISFGGTTAYFLWLNYKDQILQIVSFLPKSIIFVLCIGSAGIIAALGIWLFRFKKLSAMGRLLFLDVTWDNITDHFWFGTGLGRFTWYYPQWQATYFSAHPKPLSAYLMSADESYIIFNEYLQLFKTIGLPGFLICVYGLYRFFRLRAISDHHLLNASKCTVVAVLCNCFTSYPMHVNTILVITGTCLAIGFSLDTRQNPLSPKRQWVNLNKALVISCSLLACFSFHKGYSAYNATVKLAALRTTRDDRTLSQYRAILPALENNGKFLTEYGTLLLSDSTRRPTAIGILEKAQQLMVTRQGTEALIQAYINAGKYNMAVSKQQFLASYLPNNFLPRYDLLQLFVLKGDTSAIIHTGRAILKMPVKIPSSEVTQIRENTRNILKKYL
jgi:hypothetical protein